LGELPTKKDGRVLYLVSDNDIFTSEIGIRGDKKKMIRRPESGQQRQSQKIGHCPLEGECTSMELE